MRRFDTAKEFYTRAEQMGAASGDYSFYQLALVAGLQKDYNEKVSLLDRLASKYPDSPYNINALYEKVIKDDPKPVPAPIVVNTAGSPTRGAANAPVTIVQFSEFQCPFCSRVEPTLDQLLKDYDGKIKIVFKQMPLAFHNNAQKAAEASLFAHENGKFWELHAKMFANQSALSIEDLKKYATEVGLDAAALEAALNSNKYAAAVKADTEDASKAGISGTPSFLINGKLVVGALPIDAFKKEIDAALAAAK